MHTTCKKKSSLWLGPRRDWGKPDDVSRHCCDGFDNRLGTERSKSVEGSETLNSVYYAAMEPDELSEDVTNA
jgi:hypothetical protein